MTEGASARLNREIVQRYGNLTTFKTRIFLGRSRHGISKRALALRAGLCYTHILKVLSGKVKPQLETMLLLDEALEQLIEYKEEEND